MPTEVPYHNVSTIKSAETCIADLRKLLSACQHDFRRLNNQTMGIPQAIKKLERSIRHPDPDVINELIAHWGALRRCHSLVRLGQTFQSVTEAEHKRAAREQMLSASSEGGFRDNTAKGTQQQAIYNVLKFNSRVQVDVVEGGAEWVQVRLLQPRRLAMQMAESGWSWGCHAKGCSVPPDEWEDVSLTKRLKLLIGAAKLHHHEYKTPSIRLVLPLISRDNIDFDILFDQFAKMDSQVQVIIEDKDSPFMTSLPPPNFVSNLMGDPLATLTPTIILDHTVLVDLISDLTHCRLETQPWQVAATRAQIEEENSHEGGWMAKWLYPVLRRRRLVTTRATAEHLHEVLKTVGTATEQERARLLVPKTDGGCTVTREHARIRFQQLSIHRLPDDVQVPVEIDPHDWLSRDVVLKEARVGQLSTNKDVCQQTDLLSAYNLTALLSSWALGNTMITSNKELKGLAQRWIKSMALSKDNAFGPTIYTLQVARYMLSSHASPRPHIALNA